MEKKIIFNKFDSLEAFSNWLQVTPQTEKGKEYNNSIKNSFSFTGTKTFEQAQYLLKYGDKENADKINATIRKIKAQGKGNTTRNNILGSLTVLKVLVILTCPQSLAVALDPW